MAIARNRVIGRAGRIPWHLPEDLKRFKQVTLGHPVVMGRKTYDSILASLGTPLPGRPNIVVSRSASLSAPGCTSARSIEEALTLGAQLPGGEEIHVIGGAEIYALAMPYATHLDITEIERDFEGDTFFPSPDWSEWTEVSRERHSADGLDYAFVIYQRRPKPK